MEVSYKVIQPENPITFGTYEGWEIDELFGADVFIAIKEIEAFEKPLSNEVNEVYQSLLKMVKKAKKEFNQNYYAKRRKYWESQKIFRSASLRKKRRIFDYRLESVKEYIEQRFS